MHLSACPNCAMPRSDADIAERPCPLCGHVFGQAVAPYVEEPAVAEVEAVALPPASLPARRIPSMVIGIASMAFGAALVSAFLPAKVRDVMTVQTVLATSINAPASNTATKPAPAVTFGDLALAAKLGASNTATKPAPAVTLLEPVWEIAPLPREVEAVAVAPPKPVEVVPGGIQLIRLNRPKEVYTMERIGEGNTIKLTGKVSKLIVSGVDGGATLDATELDTKTISFNGRIEGNATIKLNMPNGTLTFSKAISGGANIDAQVPGGSISFSTPGATVSGGAKLKLTGKSVWFHTRIDGGCTIDVTVSNLGSMKFLELAEGSKIHYRGEKPEADVKISPGRIDESSECKRH